MKIYIFKDDFCLYQKKYVNLQEGIVTSIEVKAAENLQSKSLSAFIKRNPELKGLCLSMSGYKEQEWMRNKPLYAI